jgi:hypothetical protein
LNLDRASLLAIPGAAAGQDFTPKLARLFLNSLHHSDFFINDLLPAALSNRYKYALFPWNTQNLGTVFEAHTIVTPFAQKLVEDFCRYIFLSKLIAEVLPQF